MSHIDFELVLILYVTVFVTPTKMWLVKSQYL